MASDEPIDDQYLYWLCTQISETVKHPASESYQFLIEHAYKTEFYWSVPNDHNRVADGVDLRFEFLEDEGFERDQNFIEIDCSILEMLVALCRRLEFATDRSPNFWFKTLLDNLSIAQLTDQMFSDDLMASETLDDIWGAIVYRHYQRNGAGGLFPLKRSRVDQRKVEIWDQMSAYLMENNYL